MDLVQRLPKAIIVTLAALLLFGGTIGFVAAASGDAAIPASMQIAPPHVGDEWSYTVQFAFAEGDDSDSGEELWNYAWGETTIVFDEDGNPRHVQPLIDADYGGSLFIDVDTHRIVAQSHHHSDNETRTRTGNPLPVGVNVLGSQPGWSSNYEGTVEWDLITYGNEPAPCGFHSEMHERSVDLSAPVLIHGDCRDFSEEADATAFRAFEARDINGLPTVGFQASDDYGTTKVWYNAGIPYPVAMDYELNGYVFEFNFGDETMAITVDIDASVVMTHFTAGTDPWGLKAEPLPPALAPVTVAPAGTIGVDDAGTEHPFLLSEAYQGAMASLTFPELRDYMAANPDARAVVADYWLETDGNYDVHRWSFLMWSQDGGKLGVEAERQIARPGTLEATTQEITGPEEDYWRASQFLSIDLTTVDPNRIPDVVPRVADAFERFEQGTGLVPNDYGFDYTCLFFCFTENRLALQVAHASEVLSNPNYITGESGSFESLLHEYEFDDEGRLFAEYRTAREGTTTPDSLLGNGGSAVVVTDADVDEGSGGAPVWIPPTAQAAAGVTFFAFIVGAAYWLWPTIKAGGFLGLFSRVHAGQMLEHPVRANIFETVQDQPGIHYQGIVREVGKGRGVVEHHLRKLQQGGYVVSQKNSGHTCFFPKGIVDHRVMAAVPVLKTEGASNVLSHVVRNGTTTVTELAQRLGIAKSTASHHVRRLRQAGLLEPTGPVAATPAARQALTMAA